MDLFLLGTGLNTELYDRASALLPVDLMQGKFYFMTFSYEQSRFEERFSMILCFQEVL